MWDNLVLYHIHNYIHYDSYIYDVKYKIMDTPKMVFILIQRFDYLAVIIRNDAPKKYKTIYTR